MLCDVMLFFADRQTDIGYHISSLAEVIKVFHDCHDLLKLLVLTAATPAICNNNDNNLILLLDYSFLLL